MTPDAPTPDPTGAPASPVPYREAFEFVPDALLLTDLSGIILEANYAAAYLLRRTKEFLLGKPIALFPPKGAQERFYQCLGRFKHGATHDSFDARLARRGEPPLAVAVAVRVSDSFPPVAVWLIQDMTEKRKAEAARAELQRRLATAQEDERRRVARDLHDTVGQTLTGLALAVAAGRLDRVKELADALARELHQVAVRLRPTALDDVGLDAAAKVLVEQWARQFGVAVEFQAVGLDAGRLPADAETALYRVVQEALTNAARYAGAQNVSVIVGRRDGEAVAVVEDDGAGFDPSLLARAPTPGKRGGLGLLGMRERVGLLGGVVEIESEPGRGTTIIARIPLDTGNPV